MPWPLAHLPGRSCHFEDSDFNCWEPEDVGVCGRPKRGAAAFVQHADLLQALYEDGQFCDQFLDGLQTYFGAVLIGAGVM